MTSNVRPEFGPTLPSIIGPKWRELGRPTRALISGALIAVALLSVYLLLGGGSSTRTVEVATPVAFSLQYDSSALVQRVGRPDQLLRLESPAGAAPASTLTVAPLLLAPYRGSLQGVLPLTAQKLTAQMSSADPSLIIRAEAPVLLEEQPGYQIVYQFLRGGKTFYGRRVLLFAAQPGARSGVDVMMTAPRSTTTQTAASVGQQPPLREPYRSIVVDG